MRLASFALAAFLPFTSFALTITGFSGRYEAPNGHGIATQFSLPDQSSRKSIEVIVEGRGEGYVLITPDGEWEWSEPSAWVKDLKNAQWSGVDVVLGDGNSRVAVSTLNGVHEDKSVAVSGLSASCQGSGEILESCLNGRSSIRLGKLDYASSLRHDTYTEILNALVRALEIPERGSVAVENLKLDVANGKFKGEVSIKASISATVKFEGLIQYNTAEKKVSVRLDKAKALFLDVRGKIFDELEKVQSESLIVQRPWIHFVSE